MVDKRKIENERADPCSNPADGAENEIVKLLYVALTSLNRTVNVLGWPTSTNGRSSDEVMAEMLFDCHTNALDVDGLVSRP